MDLGILQDMGVGLIIMVLAALAGFAATVVTVVRLFQGRRVPPVLGAAGVGLAAAGGTLTGLLESLAWTPDDVGTMRIIALTTAGARLLTPLVVGPVVISLLLGTCFVGARAAPRRVGLAAAVGLLGLAAAAVIGVAGVVIGDMAFTTLRAALYAGLAVFVGVAMLSGGPDEGNGPEAGAAAALSFPLVVAAGEGARRGLIELMMLLFDVSAHLPEERGALVTAFYDAVAAEVPWSWATLGVACLVGLVGCVSAARGGERGPGALLGLVWLGAALLIYALGDVGPERMSLLLTRSP